MNGECETKIDLSKIEIDRHYIVIMACGHIQDDYCIAAIGHAYKSEQNIAFSLNKTFSDNMFSFSWKRNRLTVTITMKSTASVKPTGMIIFI